MDSDSEIIEIKGWRKESGFICRRKRILITDEADIRPFDTVVGAVLIIDNDEPYTRISPSETVFRLLRAPGYTCWCPQIGSPIPEQV